MARGTWDCINRIILESLRRSDNEDESNGLVEAREKNSYSRGEALQLCAQRPRVESIAVCTKA